jgi:hypothetical protein
MIDLLKLWRSRTQSLLWRHSARKPNFTFAFKNKKCPGEMQSVLCCRGLFINSPERGGGDAARQKHNRPQHGGAGVLKQCCAGPAAQDKTDKENNNNSEYCIKRNGPKRSLSLPEMGAKISAPNP